VMCTKYCFIWQGLSFTCGNQCFVPCTTVFLHQ